MQKHKMFERKFLKKTCVKQVKTFISYLFATVKQDFMIIVNDFQF